MSDTDRGELEKSIRTLTSLLHKFKVHKPPSRHPTDILPFLRHFTTLLTLGDKYDKEAKKVIAVTGSINSNNQVRTLVASQNPHLRSAVETILLKHIEKRERPLEEVVKGPLDPTPLDHVADVWSALFAFTTGPDNNDRYKALELFFISRSYRKFFFRFKEGTKVCGGRRLSEVINDWAPDRPEITHKWVRPQSWLITFKHYFPSIESRTIKGEVEWEFSDNTKTAWAKILQIALEMIDNAIDQVKANKDKSGKKAEELTQQAMKTVNAWCRVLCYFVTWKAEIVKTLLTKTNIVASITTEFTPVKRSEFESTVADTNDDDDYTAEFLQEPNESKGEQVYRYLKTIIAWHNAVASLSADPTLPELLQNIEIGFVEVPPSPSSVLTSAQISEELFARFPSTRTASQHILSTLTEYHKDTFFGCVHAEATLMGLVNYFGHETTYASTAINVTQDMRNLLQPVADPGSAVIAVSKKCCWCCDWLGQRLETKFKLPGTHGIMFPWDPPRVGVSVSVLKELEKTLWDELQEALLNKINQTYTRHSSAPSSPGREVEMVVRTPPEQDMALLGDEI